MKKYFAGRSALVTMLLFGLSACGGGESMYEWGGYQSGLLRYYKNPQETQRYADSVLEAIQKAEETDRVPPGLYAEYGYAMLKLDDAETATEYFSKERYKWPESTFLMNSVIDRLTFVETDAEPTTPSNN